MSGGSRPVPGAAGAAPRGWSLALVLLVMAGAGRPATAAPPPPRLGPAPNFALTTQQNGRLWLTELRGRVVVLTFGCTACGACPGLVPALSGLAGRLGDAPGRRAVFVLVTVDPARDTPAALRAYARARDLRAPAWLLLTEERAGEIDVVTGRYAIGVRRTPGGVEAECVAVLVDADGQVRGRYGAGALDALERALRAVVAPSAPR